MGGGRGGYLYKIVYIKWDNLLIYVSSDYLNYNTCRVKY